MATRKTASKSKAKAKPAKRTPAKAKAKATTAAPKGGSKVIGQLGMVTLHVHDYQRALEFYRDTLELPLLDTMEEVGWFEVGLGPVKLGVHADGGKEEGARPPGHTSGFYFVVRDVDRAVATLRSRGVKITDEPSDQPYGREATITDPDGNLMALLTPR
jgi:predicted enzyme related to lactoylglutathione lyase